MPAPDQTAPGNELAAYVPRHVVARATGMPTPATWRAVGLFVDVSGFTPLSEELAALGAEGAEELTSILNRHFTGAIGIVERYGGVVGRFGGDAMTVLFPIDEAQGGGAEEATVHRAVAAALELQAGMARFDDLTTSVGPARLSCKAGLAVGTVHAVDVEAEGRREWLLMGSAIDACAAAEHVAEPGEVVRGPSLSWADGTFSLSRREGGHAAIARLTTDREVPFVPLLPVEDPDPATHDRLATYLHPSLAALIAAGRGRFVSEHRRVVVLFVRFDGLAADPRASIRQIQEAGRAALEATARYGGNVHQLDAGDKGTRALITFGAVIAHEDDDERALHCALAIRDALPSLQVTVGIAAGVAFVGALGAATRREYTVMGDTVNLAARLMQSAPAGHVWATTALHAGGRFSTRPTTPIAVKGKRERIRAVEIVGVARTAPVGSATRSARRYPLQGRAREHDMLRSALLGAVAGDGSTVIVRGPAGAGKSRLATEIVHDAAGSGVDVHEGIASSTGSGAPFEPLRPLFRSLLAIDETGPVSAHELAVATDPSFATRLPLLGTLVGVSLPQTPLTASLDPGLRQELLAGVARDLIVAKARVRPRLLLLDDLHWADPATISLLVSLVPDMVSTPALMVLLARSQEGDPDPLSRLGSSHGVGSIDLGALPPAELAVHAAHVASSIFGRPIAADDLRTTVVPRASGNPYFAEQILRLCAERDIDPTDEAAVAEAGLPETVQRLLLARLDLLPEDQKATLKVASVIGRRFAEPWVVGVEPTLGTAADVHASLARTEAAGMTTGVASPGEPQHEFRHSLIHETTYGTIAAAIRRSLHGAVGRYIERRWAADLAPHAAALALHFGRTEDRDRQRRYYRLAGDLARDAAAHETAIGHYERLLPLLDPTGRADVARLLGEELQQTGDWAAAERAFTGAIDAAVRGDRSEARLRAEAALGYLHAHTGDPTRAAERLLATSRYAEVLGSREASRESLEFLVFACQQAGNLDGSLRAARRLASLAERTGDGVAECLAAQGEAVVHWLRGDYGVARASFERSLGIAREMQYVRGSVHGANDFAGMLAEIGELENAFAQVTEGLEVARSVGYRHLEALLIGNAGELYRQHGDLEPAERCTLTALAISGSMRDWPGIITRVGNMALILRERGDADPADRWATLALDLAVAVDDPVSVATFLHEHAAILASLGRDGEARERNEEAMARAETLELRDVWLRAAILDLGFRLRAGELDRASALASLDALRSEDPVPTERAELAFAASLLAEGDEARRREAEEALAAIVPSMPNPTNRARFEIVTGHVPPEVPSLPPLAMGDERTPTREEALALARELLEERREG